MYPQTAVENTEPHSNALLLPKRSSRSVPVGANVEPEVYKSF